MLATHPRGLLNLCDEDSGGRNRWADLAPAAVLILSCLGWTLISYRFRFGQDHTERPILAFLVIWLTAWMAFAWSAFRLYSDRPFPRTGLILAVATKYKRDLGIGTMIATMLIPVWMNQKSP